MRHSLAAPAALALAAGCTLANPAFDPVIADIQDDGETDESDTIEPDEDDSSEDESTEDSSDESTGSAESETTEGETDTEGETGIDTGTGEEGMETETQGDPLCEPSEPLDTYFNFSHASLANLETGSAPGFNQLPEGCYTLLVCSVALLDCEPEDIGHYLLKKVSGTDTVSAGESPGVAAPIYLRIVEGPQPCGEPLYIGPEQSIGVAYFEFGFETLPVRLPCYDEPGLDVFLASDGSTFWDEALEDPAALW
ncbi:hypothetical protein PPSIR1_40779 [Plesiocystis pacifica SIR-1]|uniref:Lipoprotein n=1 Tax=Plesiocystis pacifica SIR-1 TaxID=391625 RepID=A6GHD3_9BACT|nr:hypothetical protein [Plesiocystis pacifica]EDM74697.1 hypothetical protein PPSIR1_40779 [Plesiocystis pacifica SIR-1]